MKNKMQVQKINMEEEAQLIPETKVNMNKPIAKPRQDWDEAFTKMRMEGDDALLIDSVLDNGDWD